jgi:hypothetical protein
MCHHTEVLGPYTDRWSREGGSRRSWKKLCDQKLHNLYFNKNMVMSSRRVRWAGHVAFIGAMGYAF